jgi:hypothetical protein
MRVWNRNFMDFKRCFFERMRQQEHIRLASVVLYDAYSVSDEKSLKEQFLYSSMLTIYKLILI